MPRRNLLSLAHPSLPLPHLAPLAQHPTHLAAAAATLVGSSSVSLFVCWLVGWFVGCLSGWLTGCVSARSPHQRQKQQNQQQQQPEQQQQRAQLLPWRYGCDYVVAAALTPSSLDIVRWHYYIALPLWVASLQRAKNPERAPSSWQSKTTKATPQKGGHGQTARRVTDRMTINTVGKITYLQTTCLAVVYLPCKDCFVLSWI